MNFLKILSFLQLFHSYGKQITIRPAFKLVLVTNKSSITSWWTMSELLLSLSNYSAATCFSEDIPGSQPASGTAVVRISEQMADSAQSCGPTLCLCSQHKISCWDWSQPSLASLNKITFLQWMPTRLCNRHTSNRTWSPKMLYKKDDACPAQFYSP